jgi:hypothetical protein
VTFLYSNLLLPWQQVKFFLLASVNIMMKIEEHPTIVPSAVAASLFTHSWSVELVLSLLHAHTPCPIGMGTVEHCLLLSKALTDLPRALISLVIELWLFLHRWGVVFLDQRGSSPPVPLNKSRAGPFCTARLVMCLRSYVPERLPSFELHFNTELNLVKLGQTSKLLVQM